MGRGRAKAKQTKVARDLKYRSYSTDFASLERELRGDDVAGGDLDELEEEFDDEEYDEYAYLAEQYVGDEEARRIS